MLYSKQASIISNPETVATKQQYIKNPSYRNDPSYIETHIFSQLNKLMLHRYCNNFIYLYDWYKSYIDYDEPSRSKSEQQINLVMEVGDKTFFQWKKQNKTVNVNELKEIMFQVIWGLMVAQDQLKFMHNDMHAKNIMINKSNKHHYYYNSKYNKMWECPQYVVKLCDFGSAQIECINERTKRKQTYGIDPSPFDEMVDRNKLYESLKGIKLANCDNLEEEKANFEEVKRLLKFNIKKYLTLEELLNLDFFDSMVVDRKDITDDQSIYSYETKKNNY